MHESMYNLLIELLAEIPDYYLREMPVLSGLLGEMLVVPTGYYFRSEALFEIYGKQTMEDIIHECETMIRAINFQNSPLNDIAETKKQENRSVLKVLDRTVGKLSALETLDSLRHLS